MEQEDSRNLLLARDDEFHPSNGNETSNGLSVNNCEDEEVPQQNRDGQDAFRTRQFQERSRHVKNVLDVKLQSLDYDICDSELHRSEMKRKYDQVQTINCCGKQLNLATFETSIVNLKRWCLFGLIGVCTGFIAFLIDITIKTTAQLKFDTIKKYTQSTFHTDQVIVFILLWCVFNVGIVLLAAFPTALWAPIAAGSGIPQIKCYLNGVKIPEVVRLKTLVTKVWGVTMAVVGGLTIGKEGPMIHSGSVVAAGITQGKSTSCRFDSRLLKSFRTDVEKRDFVAGGAAAGVAAAFGAPIGGVLFSLEEGASFYNQLLIWQIFFASMVSSVTLNMCQSFAEGEKGRIGYSGLINFGEFNSKQEWGIRDLGFFIPMGIIGGLTGALFNALNTRLTKFRKRYVYHWTMRIAEVALVAFVTTGTAFVLIFLLKDCQFLGKDAAREPFQGQCPDGRYNSMASLWFQTPEDSVKSLFHDPPGAYENQTLVIFAVVYFVLSCWTYGCSVPSGLFIPTLLTGAAWGRLYWGTVLQGPSQEYNLDPGIYALIGAAAQLGGVVRMTISLTVILVEATGNIRFGIPIMMTLMFAKFIGDLFNEGIYDIHIELNKVPILKWSPPIMSKKYTAQDVMSTPVVSFRTVEKVGRVIDVLLTEYHEGFPIVDDSQLHLYQPETPQGRYGLLKGIISRNHLLVLLQRKVFCDAHGQTSGNRHQIGLADFMKMYPRYPPIQEINVSFSERECLLDLTPYMNSAPHTVFNLTCFERLYQLFRGLGLRHVIVTDCNNMVMGMITRKDLAKIR